MLNQRRFATAACDTALEFLRAINLLNRDRSGVRPTLSPVLVSHGVSSTVGLGTSERCITPSLAIRSIPPSVWKPTRDLFNETGA
jgi:hypothetical protein